MGTNTLDANILATMTADERAAVEGQDEDEINAAAGAADDDADDADDGKQSAAAAGDGDDEGDAEPAVDAAAKADAAPAAAAAESPAAPVAPATATSATSAAQPPFRFELPADYEERAAAVKSSRAAAFAQLKEGEITPEELQERLSSIDEEQSALNDLRVQHNVAKASTEQFYEMQRRATIEAVFDRANTPDGGGIDYRTDAAKVRDLDLFVKALASDEANNDKPLVWFFDEAHRRVLALHGGATAPAPAPAPTPAPAAKKTDAQIKAEAAAARVVDRSETAPKSLAHVPGGDGVGDVGGEFDDVMSLDGEEFEAAIQKMARTNPDRFRRFQSESQ